MSRQIRAFCVLLALLSLAACESTEKPVARQVVVDWPEEQLAFVADTRVGRVQSYRLGGGALVAQTQGVSRASVRDIRLEPQGNKLWVLGNDGVYLYAARGLALQKHFPLPVRKVAALRLEAGGVLLLDHSGVAVGRIDSATLVASWTLPPSSA
jgi:hypothetical protein